MTEYQSLLDSKFYRAVNDLMKCYKVGDEPLDGDEVDNMVEMLKNEINLLEGNITPNEAHQEMIKLCEQGRMLK